MQGGAGVDIALGLSLRARKGGDFTTAETYSRRAITAQSSDLRALSSLAEVLLEPILTREGIGFTRLIPAEAQGRFDEAVELLRRAWEQLATRDDVSRYDHIVANLVTALDVAGRESESERILDQALRIAPRSPPLLRLYAQKMARVGEWRDVLTTLASIPLERLSLKTNWSRCKGFC